jgi:plastocyanin
MHGLTTRQLVVFATALVVTALIITLFSGLGTRGGPTQPAASNAGPPLPPAPSAYALQQLKAHPTFQSLVSYTDSGFSPSVLSVKAGDTVRFTNNSSQQLWIAAIGTGTAAIYPGTSDCGGSTFDSCQPLQPGEFWQFAFTEPGTYDFENNLEPSKSGSITITVQ